MDTNNDKTYSLKVDSVLAWTRRGSDFYTPKYRSMLISSVAVFCGVIIALITVEVAGLTRLPLWITPPSVVIIGGVILYAQHRLLSRERNVKMLFTNMSFQFDFSKEQLYYISDNGEKTEPIFCDKGFGRALQHGENLLLLQGSPNLDLIIGLEKRLTTYNAPSFAYRDFVIGLMIKDKKCMDIINQRLQERQAEINNERHAI